MDSEQLEKLLKIVPTRRDLLAILEALAEPHHGELTAVQTYAFKIRQRLLSQWKDELNPPDQS